MLKRIILLLLCLSLIFGCFACTSSSSSSNNETETQGSESASDTDSDTDTEATSDSDTGSDTSSESTDESKNESESESESAEDNSSTIKLSGENRYKIVYAKGLSETTVKRIANRLKALDKAATTDDYYTLTTDETPADGSPEILVGATNRAESAAAKAALESYLDYSITIADNKIVIFANTEDRIADAIQKFLSGVSKATDGVIYTPEDTTYINKYDDYTYPSLSIGGTDINKFSIVIPENATSAELDMASTLQLWIAENSGALLPIVKDSEPASATEIIIGKANRTETEKYIDEFRDTFYYAVETKDTKLIFITGISDTYLSALSLFKAKVNDLNGKIDSLSEYNSVPTNTKKKAIFIGNSFVFWGNCVNFIKYTDQSDDALDLQTRLAGEDNGYFKQICKANGIDMTVYNFTYGGKNLDWVYTNKLSTLDASFFEDIDYVFISEAGQNETTFKATFNKIAKLFPNAEKTAYLAHEYTFRTNATHIINALPELANDGIAIVPWGKLVYDVHTGATTVPGATLSYNKNSFIKNSTGALPENSAVVSLSGNGDNYHQNPLSGYITAQMCFSAISGVSAQGQKYDFCGDKTLGPQYDFENFLSCHYNNGETSNFIEIFNSAPDMLGLQKLIDAYMQQYN